MSNVYYKPESFGVETVGEIELEEGLYSFNLVLVLRDLETGKFYVNQDSGCSCPSPFEDFKTKESLGQPLTVGEAIGKINQFVAARYDKNFIPDALSVIARIIKY